MATITVTVQTARETHTAARDVSETDMARILAAYEELIRNGSRTEADIAAALSQDLFRQINKRTVQHDRLEAGRTVRDIEYTPRTATVRTR